ncbi:hypothetical protein BST92_10710 [Nonlabens arenilitoris]|uniref:Uncharacterized protein n=2 Tax=Nonlabens arenilitoris TaxID=1217969 RepID=A0A2S7UBQ2_9FLAO|nr:hypothetical protein BST92_10710 [Nonlabens arenilitoris]
MKNVIISIVFCLFINITMAQFPSFRASEKSYSPLTVNDADLVKFGDSVSANRVVITIYKEDLNIFLKEKIDPSLDFDLLQKTDLSTFQKKMAVNRKRLDTAQIALYDVIKENIEDKDGLILNLKSIDYDNATLDDFINMHFIAESVPASQDRFPLFKVKYHQALKQLDAVRKKKRALLDNQEFIEAERLTIIEKKFQISADTLKTLFHDARDSTNIKYNIFKENQIDPVQHIYARDHGKLYFVNESALQFNTDAAVVNTEFAATFFGPLRVNFGTVLSTGSNDEVAVIDPTTPIVEEVKVSEESKQRLITGGGNTYLGLELPFLYYSSHRFTFFGYMRGRMSLELDDFSDDVDTSSVVFSSTGHVVLAINSDDRAFNFYVQASYGSYTGASAFRERLGVEEKVFDFGFITAGVTIKDSMRISVNFKPISSQNQLRDGKFTLGIQFLPNLFKT